MRKNPGWRQLLLGLLLMAPLALPALPMDVRWQQAERVLAGQGLTPAKLEEAYQGRLAWYRQHTALSPAGYARLKPVLGGQAMFEGLASLLARTLSDAELRTLNGEIVGSAPDPVLQQGALQKLEAAMKQFTQKRDAAEEKILLEDLIFQGPLDGSDYLARFEKFVAGGNARLAADRDYALMLHGMMLKTGELKFGREDLGLHYFMLRLDPSEAGCKPDPDEYRRKQATYTLNSTPGGKDGKATCAERTLARELVRKHITPEVKRYRAAESAFFTKYVDR